MVEFRDEFYMMETFVVLFLMTVFMQEPFQWNDLRAISDIKDLRARGIRRRL